MAVIEEPCSAPLTNEEWEDKKKKEKKTNWQSIFKQKKKIGIK